MLFIIVHCSDQVVFILRPAEDLLDLPWAPHHPPSPPLPPHPGDGLHWPACWKRVQKQKLGGCWKMDLQQTEQKQDAMDPELSLTVLAPPPS